MHKTLTTIVASGVCLLCVLVGSQQGGQYTATSRVFVDPIGPGSVNPQGAPGYDQLRYVSYVDQQMQTVTRGDTLVQALRALPSGTWSKANESEQTAAGRLSKALKVERLNDGYEFSISLMSPDPLTAAAVVNAVTDAYLDGGRKDEVEQSGGRVRLLEQERQRLKADIDSDQREQVALAGSLGVANPANDGTNQFDAQLISLRAEWASARQAHDLAAAKLAAVSGSAPEQRSGLAAAADEMIRSEQGLGSMESAVNVRRTTLKSAMAGMTQQNPIYKQDQHELADLEGMQEGEVARRREQAEQRLEDNLRTDLERSIAVESKLKAQLDEESKKASSAEPKLLRAQELASDIRRLNDRYTAVDGMFRTLELQTKGPGTAHIATVAAPPALPESNRRSTFFIAAIPLGLLFGVAASVFARTIDSRVYIAADVETLLGFAPMAVLPNCEDVPQPVFEEHVLRLAAGIEGAYRRTAARTFVLTAVSARTDLPGLIEACAEKLRSLRLNTTVVSTPELLLPSAQTAIHRAVIMHNSPEEGSVTPPPVGEGVASQKLKRLRSEHDLVLVGGAALLHSAETEYVARCVDATILVVESSLTRKQELCAAAKLLNRLQVTSVAVILSELRLCDADEAFRHTVQSTVAVPTPTSNLFLNSIKPEGSSVCSTIDHTATEGESSKGTVAGRVEGQVPNAPFLINPSTASVGALLVESTSFMKNSSASSLTTPPSMEEGGSGDVRPAGLLPRTQRSTLSGVLRRSRRRGKAMQVGGREVMKAPMQKEARTCQPPDCQSEHVQTIADNDDTAPAEVNADSVCTPVSSSVPGKGCFDKKESARQPSEVLAVTVACAKPQDPTGRSTAPAESFFYKKQAKDAGATRPSTCKREKYSIQESSSSDQSQEDTTVAETGAEQLKGRPDSRAMDAQSGRDPHHDKMGTEPESHCSLGKMVQRSLRIGTLDPNEVARGPEPNQHTFFSARDNEPQASQPQSDAKRKVQQTVEWDPKASPYRAPMQWSEFHERFANAHAEELSSLWAADSIQGTSEPVISDVEESLGSEQESDLPEPGHQASMASVAARPLGLSRKWALLERYSTAN